MRIEVCIALKRLIDEAGRVVPGPGSFLLGRGAMGSDGAPCMAGIDQFNVVWASRPTAEGYVENVHGQTYNLRDGQMWKGQTQFNQLD